MRKFYKITMLVLALFAITATVVKAQPSMPENGKTYHIVFQRHNGQPGVSADLALQDNGDDAILTAQDLDWTNASQKWTVTISNGEYVFTSGNGRKIYFDTGAGRFKAGATSGNMVLRNYPGTGFPNSLVIGRSGSTNLSMNPFGGSLPDGEIAEHGDSDGGNALKIVNPKTLLQEFISQCQAELDAAPEGNEHGQFTAATKATFQVAINNANNISNPDDYAQAYFDAITTLENAKNTFLSSVNNAPIFSPADGSDDHWYQIINAGHGGNKYVTLDNNQNYLIGLSSSAANRTNIFKFVGNISNFQIYCMEDSSNPIGAANEYGQSTLTVNGGTTNAFRFVVSTNVEHFVWATTSGKCIDNYGDKISFWGNVPRDEANVQYKFKEISSFKDALQQLAAEYQARLNTVPEGDNPGQFTTAAKAAFQSAITTANNVTDPGNDDFSQVYLDATATLKAAKETFEATAMPQVGQRYYIQGTRPENTYMTEITDDSQTYVKDLDIIPDNTQLWEVERILGSSNKIRFKNVASGNYIDKSGNSNYIITLSVQSPLMLETRMSSEVRSNQYCFFIEERHVSGGVSIRLHAGGPGDQYRVMNYTGNENDNCTWRFVKEDVGLKEFLQQFITDATTLNNNTPEGDDFGQYPQSAKTALGTAITTAQGVYDNGNATPTDLNNAITAIKQAIQTYKDALNDDIMMLVASDQNKRRWYTIRNNTTHQYARGKVISSNGRNIGDKYTFEDKTDADEQLFRFEVDANGTSIKIIDKNGNSMLYSGTISNTTDLQSFQLNLLEDSYSFNIKPINNPPDSRPLHAQQAGSHIVNYNGGVGSASAWIFDFVKETVKVHVTAETLEGCNAYFGSVEIEGETGLSVFKYPPITVKATPTPGHNFIYWSNDGGTSVVSELPTYTYTGTTDITLTAIFQKPATEIHETACNSFTWEGKTYLETGEYFEVVRNANGCDSIVHLYLTINKSPIKTTNQTACNSFTWNGQTYTETGVYTYQDANNNCDTIHKLNLTILDVIETEVTETACSSFTWENDTYTQTGTYSKTFQTVNGCDSVVTLNLTVNQPTENQISETACGNYIWNGTTYTQTGTYNQTFTATNGCDSTVYLTLSISQPVENEINKTVCSSFTWENDIYTQTGTYSKTFQTVNGCDSIVTLKLTIKDVIETEINKTTCNSFTWGNDTYTQTGTYSKTFQTVNGCDSIVILNLVINEIVETEINETTCNSFTWNNNIYYESGIYKDTLRTVNECDSIVTLNLTITEPPVKEITETACNEFTWHGQVYTETAIYTYQRVTQACDTLEKLNLTILKSTHTEIDKTVCSSFTWENDTYTQTGTYSKTFQTVHGCDSVVTLNLIVNQPTETQISEAACGNYIWNGTTYTQTGTYNQTFTAANGCDSTVYLTLSISQPVENEINETACSSFTWENDIYTQTGTYSKTFQTINGCDSIVTLNLIIYKSEFSEIDKTVCGSFTWNGEVYEQSGTYTQTFKTVNGCDSVVTLNLTVNQPTENQVSETACGNFIWNGTTYTQTGTYNQTFTAANGCDSTVYLTLSISQPVETNIHEEACGSFTWNNDTYEESGTYSKTFQTINGCDSIVTLNLTIKEVPQKPSITVDADTLIAPAANKYYWFLNNNSLNNPTTVLGQKYVISESGNYSLQIESDKGCKSELSETIYVQYSSVKDEQVRIAVYPNPVKDVLSIDGLPTATNPELKLYNIAGQLILSKKCTNSIEKIDMSNKVSGIYMLKIVDNNISRSIKIIKQ